MHVQTHLLSGWCLGNLFGLGKRGRSLAVLAAGLPDIDGLGIIFGPVAYWRYHHVICHNLLFGIFLCTILTFFSEQKKRAFTAFFVIFHLHLVMDSFGSGEDWVIYYLWPFIKQPVENPYVWSFFSWQNITTAIIFVLWMIGLVFYAKRTFLEWVMPKLDRQIVELAEILKRKFREILSTIKQ
ncbi:MAG: metal-dependent hydrolase [Planctomycetota bacterium]